MSKAISVDINKDATLDQKWVSKAMGALLATNIIRITQIVMGGCEWVDYKGGSQPQHFGKSTFGS